MVLGKIHTNKDENCLESIEDELENDPGESNMMYNSVEMMESSLNCDHNGNIITFSLDVDNNDEDGERVIIVTTEKDSYLKNVNCDNVADEVKEKTARKCYDQ
ncbi:11173_t:CDS:2 [Entrophospora sp. SA101]|nr:11173_t:CDS:2 [Entrophospora sp. SA101]